MVKDIIISYRLSNNHYRVLQINRTAEELTHEELGYRELDEFAKSGTTDFANYDEFISLMRLVTPETFVTYLPAFNYLNVYIDVVDRPDLSEESVTMMDQKYPVRVYLINPDKTAIAIASEDPTAGSLPSAVMNMFINKLSVDPDVGAILKTQYEIDSFNALQPSGSEIEYDCSKFYNFVTANGRTIRVFVEDRG